MSSYTQLPRDSGIANIKNRFPFKKDNVWQQEGEKLALELFHKAAREVPAYKQFLLRHNINPQNIITYKEFLTLPYTDKKNYIDVFPLQQLIWKGDFTESMVINASSGTTGVPYFWPSAHDQTVQGSIIKELIYSDIFGVKKKKTLLVICFGMGTWIAGSHTFLTSLLVGQKGYPLSIITPGFNKEETLRILQLLSSSFEQTIIAGIPTFVKDVIEEWKKTPQAKAINIKFLFAAEGFPEEWRQYLLEAVDSQDQFHDAINIYGSADAAIMGFETPLTILIRKIATWDKKVRHDLFHDERVPAFYNYIPQFRFFETEDGELLLTAKRTLPLIRYNIHDQGNILSYSQVNDLLLNCGYSLAEEMKKNNIKSINPHLPFVYVFGRGKFTATLYAANIYPENIRDVLSQSAVRKFVTGKFTLETMYHQNHDHYLQVNVELVKGVKDNQKLRSLITETFIAVVRKENSEYNRIFEEYSVKAKPQITLYPYGDETLFPKGTYKKVA